MAGPALWMRMNAAGMTDTEIETALRGKQDDPGVRAMMEVLTRKWRECVDAVQAHPLHGGKECREYEAGALTGVSDAMTEITAWIGGMRTGTPFAEEGDGEEDRDYPNL